MANMIAFERCKYFNVANIKGMAYMPGPSNYTMRKEAQYFDSDFYNQDFVTLWGLSDPNFSRNDLLRFGEKLGVNFIHCYDWSAPVWVASSPEPLRNHIPFLKYCNKNGMQATIPISNYTMYLLSQGEKDKAQVNFKNIFAEIYPGPSDGAGMWKIFNEFDLWYDRNPDHVVTVMEWLVQLEDTENLPDAARLPIMVDTSFGITDGIPGAGVIKPLWQALKARGSIGHYKTVEEFWTERFVFSTNPQNEGSFIANYLKNSLNQYWIKSGIPIPPVMFTELGSNETQTGGEQEQAAWLEAQLTASEPGVNNPMMLGACVFLNEERPWMTGPERTYGIMRFGSSDSNDWKSPSSDRTIKTQYPAWNAQGVPYAAQGSYPVEQQIPKLNYSVVAKAWGSS